MSTTTMSATAAYMANETTADGTATGEVVIPMMVAPITTKNSHISTIAAIIVRAVSVTHHPHTPGYRNQSRSTEEQPQPLAFAFSYYIH
jgi:hypothetical protein